MDDVSGTEAGAGPLRITFVRHPGARDEVVVERPGGDPVTWTFPSSGDGPPHDLIHVVVESELGITDGFWGLVRGGAAVRIEGDHATLVRAGVPLVELPGADFSGLVRAEEAVAIFGATGVRVEEGPGPLVVATLDARGAAPADAAGHLGFSLPAHADRARVAVVHDRLDELARSWGELGDGGTIVLDFG